MKPLLPGWWFKAMNRKLYIHIGLHKTGSTSLQKGYFPEFENLTYLKSFDLKLFTNKWENSEFLISSEGLTGIPWNKKWISGIKNDYNWIDSFKLTILNLKTIFPNAHLIIVFRKHGDLLISLYKQYLHEGGVLNFDEFYGETNGVITDKDINFKYRISFLKEHFDQVDILSFEKFKSKGINYFNEYFYSLGFVNNDSKEEKKKYNQGVSGKKIEMLRKANRFYYILPDFIKRVLYKVNLTPRRIFQNRLQFWNSPDSPQLIAMKNYLNKKFQEDWAYVEENEFESI